MLLNKQEKTHFFTSWMVKFAYKQYKLEFENTMLPEKVPKSDVYILILEA